jgi:hypothetical protein
MARTKLTLTRALVLYLALLPVLGAGAEAQSENRPVESARPFDPPRQRADGETIFRPAAEPVTIRAFNGFSSNSTPGLFSHRGHGHAGGVATVDSPWGEQLRIRYWRSPHGVTVEYDDDLKVRYRFDETGRLEEIVAETPDREARMAVGNRAELAYLGQRDFGSFDLSAYVLIEEALRAKHSEAFLAGLGRFDAPAEVSCTTQGIQCAACVLAWAVSVGAITTACVVGGVPTFGTSCFLAILAHEATNYSCAATCMAWIQDCYRTSANGQPIPDGCEP